jgi:esterase/lipase superfamily enzyme
MIRYWNYILFTAMIAFVAACAANRDYQIELMPAPELYATNLVDPFEDMEHISEEEVPYRGILYATDRKPSEEERVHYENQRGFALRLGMAEIILGGEALDWEEARRISLLKNRSAAYPLKVSAVHEFGVLDRSASELMDPDLLPSDLQAAATSFSQLVNAKLAISRQKEILIYVHGYKVVFDNPVLVTTELWHFLGYDGVAIAFAWPATPSRLAYFSDIETAALSAFNLRLLIEYLAEETDAESINIIGYSAGTRVVIDALGQLALIHARTPQEESKRELPIGQVILVGSDYDRGLFAANLMDGMLKISKNLTIYASETDRALSLSQWLFGRNRLGQMWTQRPLKPHVQAYLEKNESLRIIDVTKAESAGAGNGHAYFRSSPWVSSDILVSLHFGLPPAQRGLDKFPDMPVWHFPDDYLHRLRSLLPINHLQIKQP